MEVASPKIVVERLKKECIDIADASVLERTKVLDPKSKNLNPHSSAPTKLLSLYENQASASFLVANSPSSSIIHHLSSTPLFPTAYPNIHPLTTPSPTHTLPYAPSLFTSIHSIYLPALLPASSLPRILKDCHRCLRGSGDSARGGVLYLTIIDPNPLPATLGTRLRRWLDEHLIVNLERQFRCINPSRLFPIWLADAGLRGEGSVICVQRFLAAVPTAELGQGKEKLRSEQSNGQTNVDKCVVADDDEKELEEKDEHVRQELKTQVGRMLWKEMWGGFVEGDKWWWEDEKVVEECERLKTGWEYAVIAAVKED